MLLKDVSLSNVGLKSKLLLQNLIEHVEEERSLNLTSELVAFDAFCHVHEVLILKRGFFTALALLEAPLEASFCFLVGALDVEEEAVHLVGDFVRFALDVIRLALEVVAQSLIQLFELRAAVHLTLEPLNHEVSVEQRGLGAYFIKAFNQALLKLILNNMLDVLNCKHVSSGSYLT